MAKHLLTVSTNVFYQERKPELEKSISVKVEESGQFTITIATVTGEQHIELDQDSAKKIGELLIPQ